MPNRVEGQCSLVFPSTSYNIGNALPFSPPSVLGSSACGEIIELVSIIERQTSSRSNTGNIRKYVTLRDVPLYIFEVDK
jgi:hypothetical protein